MLTKSPARSKDDALGDAPIGDQPIPMARNARHRKANICVARIIPIILIGIIGYVSWVVTRRVCRKWASHYAHKINSLTTFSKLTICSIPPNFRTSLVDPEPPLRYSSPITFFSYLSS